MFTTGFFTGVIPFPDEAWTGSINGNPVDFFAPEGTSRDFREAFGADVLVAGGSAILTFDAHWTTSAVPEPASLLLLGAGLGLLGLAARRRA